MTDYLVISGDPEERGARPAVEAAALRRLLRGTVFEPAAEPEREPQPERPGGHCRYAAYYED
ncbi:hypothetical protein ABT095_18555 [Kitasatospora sp. NPDC002227]|uniref:hypothetical protein n=1 Tax=Kitasatospora sp. NPDC002227 TaxID=3154773 RepID=UPI00332A0B1F